MSEAHHSIPHRCPICEGAGVYAGPPGHTTTCSAPPNRFSHPCHGCKGSGIVWSLPPLQLKYVPPPGFPPPMPFEIGWPVPPPAKS